MTGAPGPAGAGADVGAVELMAIISPPQVLNFVESTTSVSIILEMEFIYSGVPITVTYTYLNGTAYSGIDFVGDGPTSVLLWAEGEIGNKIIEIQLLDTDFILKPDRYFLVNFTIENAILSTNLVNITILDNDEGNLNFAYVVIIFDIFILIFFCSLSTKLSCRRSTL